MSTRQYKLLLRWRQLAFYKIQITGNLLRRAVTAVLTWLLVISTGVSLPRASIAQTATRLGPVPPDSWAIQDSLLDVFGREVQGQAPYFDFNSDTYENLNYELDGAAEADIEVFGAGIDHDWVFVDVELSSPWSSNSQNVKVGIEFDVDRSDRGDFYLWLFMQSEFNNNGAWVDAEVRADYNLFEDDNNNVGGSNPIAPDSGGTDGYNRDLGTEKEKVFARIMGNGDFQIAVKRDLIDSKEADEIRLRLFTAQPGSNIDESKFTFHDQLSETEVTGIDSLPGADTNSWLPVIDLGGKDVDLTLTQAVDEIYRREGDLVVISSTIMHRLGDKKAKGIEIEIDVPVGLTIEEIDAGEGKWDDKKAKWALNELDPGESSTFSITASVDEGTKGLEFNNIAEITKIKEGDDIDESNNVADSTVFVVGWDGSVEFVDDANGTPIDTALPGDTLFIEVTDTDLNLDPALVEQMEVLIQSEDTGDIRAIPLTEVAADSGVFRGSIDTEVNPVPDLNDDSLQITVRDTAITTYVDELDSEFNFYTFLTDAIQFGDSGPEISLVNLVDKQQAAPGEVITYRVDFQNSGPGIARVVDLFEVIPTFTDYVSESMRIADFGQPYDQAIPLTDADDGSDAVFHGADVYGLFNGSSVRVLIDQVGPDDGQLGSGNDAGAILFQVIIQ